MSNFKILSIRTALTEKRIVIEATLDIDIRSVGYASVQLTEKESKRIIDYTPEVSGGVLTLNLREWPAPNTEYLLKIQQVLSVMGDQMEASLQRKIFFESATETLAEITKPADFEKIRSLEIALREIPLNEKAALTGSFYIEIARDNGFNAVVRETLTTQGVLSIMDIEPGQYYIRARIQGTDTYSEWSETKTFVLVGAAQQSKEDSDGPVLELPLTLIEQPEDGTVPQTFVFRFNADLDEASVNNVRIIKRRV